MQFKEDLKKIQKADFDHKTEDKVIQIEIFPEKVKASEKSTEEVKRKYKAVVDKFNELYRLVGVEDLSNTFILPESLYALATRVKYSLEKNLQDNKYNSIRGNFAIILDDFNEINKNLNDFQNEFHKEHIFAQGEIEKVG